MNPELDTTPGLGLPPPSAEMGPAQPAFAPEGFRGPEVSPPRFEAMTSAPSAPALSTAGQPLLPVAQPQALGTPLVPAVAQDNTTQDDSADTGALDAEWVNKAREIVERTHTDPYTQSKEIGRIKAQYIKARYSKEVKVSEEP